MTLNEYQDYIEKFCNKNMSSKNLAVMCALGLSGETGEVNELLKKNMYHGRSLDRTDLMLELGDVLWYLSTMARAFEFTMDDIAMANIVKLNERERQKKRAKKLAAKESKHA